MKMGLVTQQKWHRQTTMDHGGATQQHCRLQGSVAGESQLSSYKASKGARRVVLQEYRGTAGERLGVNAEVNPQQPFLPQNS